MTNELKKYFVRYQYPGYFNDFTERSQIIELYYTDLNLDSIKRIIADVAALPNMYQIEILSVNLL